MKCLLGVTLFGCLGSAAAAQVVDPKRPTKPPDFEKYQKLADDLRRQIEAAKRQRPKFQIRPPIRFRPPIRITHRPPKPVVNPLLVGAYKVALERFDSRRAGLYSVRDVGSAMKLLDGLERDLLEVRRALWEAEKRAKASPHGPVQVVISPLFLPPQPNFSTFTWGQNAFGNPIWVGGKPVAKSNPFLRGELDTAIHKLHTMRRELDRILDPKAARLVVDKMARQLLEIRRVLWQRQQRAAAKRRRAVR